jgi:hypothetical protein
VGLKAATGCPAAAVVRFASAAVGKPGGPRSPPAAGVRCSDRRLAHFRDRGTVSGRGLDRVRRLRALCPRGRGSTPGCCPSPDRRRVSDPANRFVTGSPRIRAPGRDRRSASAPSRRALCSRHRCHRHHVGRPALGRPGAHLTWSRARMGQRCCRSGRVDGRSPFTARPARAVVVVRRWLWALASPAGPCSRGRSDHFAHTCSIRTSRSWSGCIPAHRWP